MYRMDDNPLVLLDLFIPSMDGTGMLGGLELLELLNANFPDMPVLMLTNFTIMTMPDERSRSLGYSVIMKPSKSEIRDEIQVNGFKNNLFPELARVEAGGGAVDWNSKINIGDELRFEMGEELSPQLEPVTQSTGISLLRGMLDELNNPSLGGGIILLVLRFASEFMNRAVVFYVKKDEITGLGQFGIDDKDSQADAKIRELSIPRDADSLFSKVLETQVPLKSTFYNSNCNSYFVDQLGGAEAN